MVIIVILCFELAAPFLGYFGRRSKAQALAAPFASEVRAGLGRCLFLFR